LVETRDTPVRAASAWSFLQAAADEHRVGHDDLGVGELHAALIDDGLDRADEVLVGAHASRDAVHDDANAMGFHVK
jgi:hypothetical protein